MNNLWFYWTIALGVTFVAGAICGYAWAGNDHPNKDDDFGTPA